MALSDHKLEKFNHPVDDLGHTPDLSADALQAWFDSNSYELKDKHNALIDELEGEMVKKADAASLHSHDNKSVLDSITETPVTHEELSAVETNAYDYAVDLNDSTNARFADYPTKDEAQLMCDLTFNAAKDYADEKTAEKIGEAPTDGNTYGRKNGAWERCGTGVGKSVTDTPSNEIFNDYDTNTIGQKGYRILDIVEYVVNGDGVLMNGKYRLSGIAGLESGDLVSFKIDYNRYNHAHINYIDPQKKIIGVDNFYNGEKMHGSGLAKNGNLCTYDYIKGTVLDGQDGILYVIDKPTVGDTEEMASYSTAKGSGNRISKAVAAFVAGMNNLGAGNYCKIIGRNNKSGYGNHIYGDDNEVLESENSCINGMKNLVKGFYNTILGSNHKTGYNSVHNIVAGTGNVVEDDVAYAMINAFYGIAASPQQSVRGKYNVKDSEGKYADIFGGGTSYSNRKNIYTLDWDGNAVYKGDVTFDGNRSIKDELAKLGSTSTTYIDLDKNSRVYLSETGVYSLICTGTADYHRIILEPPKNANPSKTYHMTVCLTMLYEVTSDIQLIGNVHQNLEFTDAGTYVINADFDHITRKWFYTSTKVGTPVDAITEIAFPENYPGTLTANTLMSKKGFASNLSLFTADRSQWTLAHLSPVLMGSIILPLSVADARNTTEAMSSFFAGGEYFRFKADKCGELYILNDTALAHCSETEGWEYANLKAPAIPDGYTSWKLVPYDSIVGDIATPFATCYQWQNASVIGTVQTNETVPHASIFPYAYRKTFVAGEYVTVPTPNSDRSGAVTMMVFVKF